MVLMPGLKGKYDAWNRLVEVRDSSDNLIATYEYNGLNQRIKKTVGSTITKSFFNEKWQELESVTNNQVTSYVWGLRYIDDLVLREKGEERLYSLADPNWNVVAICDSIGSVVERMKYDAFGKITWLDNNFSVKNGSDYNWNRTFTGQVLDTETELMSYRNRFYHVGLGRFVSRDLVEYDNGDNCLYVYVMNKPLVYVDIFGLVPVGTFDIKIRMCDVPPTQVMGAGGQTVPCYDITYNPPKGECDGPGDKLSLVQAVSSGEWYNPAGLPPFFDGHKDESNRGKKFPDYPGQSSGPCNMRDAPNGGGASVWYNTVCAKCTKCVAGKIEEKILGCVSFKWDSEKKVWTGPGNPNATPPTKTTVLSSGGTKTSESSIPARGPDKVWERACKAK
jgi:RHS repeat-associated protein